MPLADKTLSEFLNDLASNEPIPGGGSVAALSGALSASLLMMVCRLTLGKKGYEAISTEMEQFVLQLLPLQEQFRDLMQKDIDAYAQVMDAYRLPKQTEQEKSERFVAVQSALKRASQVPLQVAESCAELIRLARPIAEKGNKNAASDGGVAALMAETGLRGAALNVSINVASIRDQEFVSRFQERIAELLSYSQTETRAILSIVEGRL